MAETEKRFRILIVDDDDIARAMLRAVLEPENYFIAEADSGESALEILPEVAPDLVLLDIMMRGIDGFAVLEKIRSDDAFKYVKVILLSGKTDVRERLRGYELGASDYMTKPFVGGELRAKVNVFRRLSYIEDKNIGLEELVSKEVARYKRQEEYLLSRAKLISMGDMVQAIGHHWRQPLNALGLAVQDIQDAFRYGELTEEYLAKNVEKAMKQISFMSAIIDNFSQMMREDKSDEVFCVTDAFLEALALVEERFEAAGAAVTINGEPWRSYAARSTVKYYSKGRSWILQQALTTVLNNSADAVENAGVPGGRARITVWSGDGMVRIAVTDSGGGIPEDKIARIFEPYYTTKDMTKNAGLGLYFSRVLIEKRLSGKIYVENVSGSTRFVIELPASERNSAGSNAAEEKGGGPVGES